MSPGEPTVGWFEDLMRVMRRYFEPLSLIDAVRRADDGALNGRSFSVTFDDGYADNYEVALPVLERLGIPVTFFVASGFIDGGRMWNDSIIETIRRLADGRHEFDLPQGGAMQLDDWASRRDAAGRIIGAWKHLPPMARQQCVDALAQRVPALPDDLMMSTTQLRQMADSPVATIGAHTVSHPILASLDTHAARDEMAQGKAALEAILDRDVSLFAYPNGKPGQDYTDEHVALARDLGFSAAVSTEWGAVRTNSDRFQLPRFTPWHTNLSRFVVDLARCHHGIL